MSGEGDNNEPTWVEKTGAEALGGKQLNSGIGRIDVFDECSVYTPAFLFKTEAEAKEFAHHMAGAVLAFANEQGKSRLV